MPDPTALYAIAHDALMAAEEAINGLLPAGYRHQRVHVANGPPAMDGWVEAHGCIEHLVAWIEGVAPTTDDRFPAAVTELIPCAQIIGAVTVVVQVVRCEPTLEVEGEQVFFPDAQALDDAARIVAVESWAVWQGLARWARQLAAGDDELGALVLGQVPVQPQGGIAGTETRVIVETPMACPMGDETEGIPWAPELPEDFLPDTPEE